MDRNGINHAFGIAHDLGDAKLNTEMKGYTLIETVVIVAITATAFLALVTLFFMFNTLYGYEQAFIATSGSAGTSLNTIQADVLQADQVLASHSFSGTTYTSTTTSLVLELPSIDASGNISGTAKDYVVIYATSTMLYRLVAPDATSARRSGRTQLSGTVSSMTFTYDNSDFAEVTNVIADLQTRAQFKNQVSQARVREQIYLRNNL